MPPVYFKKTLIVEQNREYVVQIRNMLKPYIDDIEFCFDGSRALEIYDVFKPDLIFVEAILPKKDDFAIMENIYDDDLLKIMVTSINQDIIIKKAFELKADYIFVKPYEAKSFVARLLDVAKHKKENRRYPGFGYLLDNDAIYRNRISSILKTLGIPANVKGYAFLREAILIALKDISALSLISERI
jgi:two-component system response regulator (stage 0 sporulation protein A)